MGKTLYEDILNWKKMQKGETIPEVHHQRILENIKVKQLIFKAIGMKNLIMFPYLKEII